MSEVISEQAARAAFDTRVAVGRLVRRFRSLAVEGDLSTGQASVLVRLDKEGPASASELAAAERVRPQSMATIVLALEEAGLVERHRDPDDGRRQLVTLTERGRERRMDVRRAKEAWLAQTLQERCTDEELRKVIEVMEIVDAVAQS